MAQKDYKNVKDKASAGVLSEVNKQKQENNDKSKSFGEYDEAPGGGSPGSKGGRGSMGGKFVVADSPDDPAAKEAKANGQKVRYMQPRTEDGKFTYNSANGKKLSTEKSRGITKVPWLRGINLTFFEKGATFNTETVGRLIAGATYTADELVEACKVYLDDERGFAGLVGTVITKKGRTSKQEQKTPQGKTGKVDMSKIAQSTKDALDKAEANKPKNDFTYKPTPRPKPQPAPAPKPQPVGKTVKFEDLTDEQKAKVFESIRETHGFENASDKTIAKMIQRGTIKLDDVMTLENKKILQAMGL